MERKRARSLSSSSSSGCSSTGSISLHSSGAGPVSVSVSGSPPPAKFHRAPSPPRTHLCTLPPSCSQPGTAQAFATAQELEAHQASRHRWVCRIPIRDKPGRVGEGGEVLVVPEQFAGRASGGRRGERWRECGKAFPDERLLDLHYTETHDPLAKERQERGEKIFECFLPVEQCSKAFHTPKKRRLHMIEKHHYPPTYFFAITNHGLNLITRTEGPAASLIRPPRERGAKPATGGAAGDAGGMEGVSGVAIEHARDTERKQVVQPTRPAEDMDIDDLAAKMAGLESSLAFVPRNVRRARQRSMGFG